MTAALPSFVPFDGRGQNLCLSGRRISRGSRHNVEEIVRYSIRGDVEHNENRERIKIFIVVSFSRDVWHDNERPRHQYRRL